MKILIVNKFLYPNGGSETYIFKLGDYLISRGHDVQYFGMDHESRCVGNNVDAYTSDMDFHGGSMLSKFTYPLKTIYSTEARRKIHEVLCDFKPDVVHLNNFNYQLTPSIILEIVKWRKNTGHTCRIIYTAHDYQLICPNHMLRNPVTQQNCSECIGGHFINCARGNCIHGSKAKSIIGSMEATYWKIRKTYQYIDMIICPSEYVKAKLDTNNLFKNKTIVIHNFIDVPEFAKVIDDKRYVLYYGRLSEEKGIRTLLNVCKELPEVSFVFAGTGPLSNEVEKIANISYRGFMQGADLWNLISNARFCICPSEWNEVFGLTIGESLELGTPVIASDIGGIPEALGDGGILFAPGDVRGLTNLIRNLWKDQAEIDTLRKKALNSGHMSVAEYCSRLIDEIGTLPRKEQ